MGFQITENIKNKQFINWAFGKNDFFKSELPHYKASISTALSCPPWLLICNVHEKLCWEEGFWPWILFTNLYQTKQITIWFLSMFPHLFREPRLIFLRFKWFMRYEQFKNMHFFTCYMLFFGDCRHKIILQSIVTHSTTIKYYVT